MKQYLQITFFLFLFLILTSFLNIDKILQPKSLPYVDSLLEKVWEVQIESDIYIEPFVKNNIIFFQRDFSDTSKIFKYAIDGCTGEKLYYNNPEVQRKFKETLEDSLICFNFVSNIYIQNIYSGQLTIVKEKNLGSRYRYTPYIIKYNTIYTIENDTILVAKDANDLSIKWKYATKRIVGNFIEHNNVVYFSDMDSIYGLEIQTGKKVFEYFSNEIVNSVCVEDEMFVLTFHNMIVIDLQTKEVVKEISNTHTAIEDVIYFSDKKIYYSDGQAGVVSCTYPELEEIYNTDGGYQFHLYGDYIIGYSSDGRFVDIIVLDKRTGEILYLGWDRFNFVHDVPYYKFADEMIDDELIIAADIDNDKIVAFRMKQ